MLHHEARYSRISPGAKPHIKTESGFMPGTDVNFGRGAPSRLLLRNYRPTFAHGLLRDKISKPTAATLLDPDKIESKLFEFRIVSQLNHRGRVSSYQRLIFG